MRWKGIIVACVFFCFSVALYAQRSAESATVDKGPYRVTNWPSHAGPDKRYVDEVERYLNQMASEGWRFHSEVVGQKVKMMVFERMPDR